MVIILIPLCLEIPVVVIGVIEEGSAEVLMNIDSVDRIASPAGRSWVAQTASGYEEEKADS